MELTDTVVYCIKVTTVPMEVAQLDYNSKNIFMGAQP